MSYRELRQLANAITSKEVSNELAKQFCEIYIGQVHSGFIISSVQLRISPTGTITHHNTSIAGHVIHTLRETWKLAQGGHTPSQVRDGLSSIARGMNSRSQVWRRVTWIHQRCPPVGICSNFSHRPRTCQKCWLLHQSGRSILVIQPAEHLDPNRSNKYVMCYCTISG